MSPHIGARFHLKADFVKDFLRAARKLERKTRDGTVSFKVMIKCLRAISTLDGFINDQLAAFPQKRHTGKHIGECCGGGRNSRAEGDECCISGEGQYLDDHQREYEQWNQLCPADPSTDQSIDQGHLMQLLIGMSIRR